MIPVPDDYWSDLLHAEESARPDVTAPYLDEDSELGYFTPESAPSSGMIFTVTDPDGLRFDAIRAYDHHLALGQLDKELKETKREAKRFKHMLVCALVACTVVFGLVLLQAVTR